MILLVVWSANADGSALYFQGKFQGQFYKNDDTYRSWDRATIIVSSFGQIEQGALIVRKSFIYWKVFLERAVVELVYKFDKKSTTSVSKGESTAKVPFNVVIYINIYKWRPAPIT